MAKANNSRPSIPKRVQTLLWLRAGGRCEFRGCNKILYEDNVTQDPINGSHIAHIISWTESGPRGDKELSPKLAKDIGNLMLTCPEHNHLIDTGENVEKYTVSVLREMKREHESAIRQLTELRNQSPRRVIELRSMIHGQRPSITEKEEADALFPFYPKTERIIIDLCDVDNIDVAKAYIDMKVKKFISDSDGDETFAAFIMAPISLGCYLGYAIGNKVSVQTYQHFRDTEDWIWRDKGRGYHIDYPLISSRNADVNLFISISGSIDSSLVETVYPIYAISAESPGFSFLQSWDQVIAFRELYRNVLDRIRFDNGESVRIHLYAATPNPISFEIGKAIMKKLDPTIILYDKDNHDVAYKKIMYLHNRITLKKDSEFSLAQKQN